MDPALPIGRRDMMTGLAAGLAVRSPETARGRVFDEGDSGRPGIPGVLVSNGTDGGACPSRRATRCS